MVEGPFDLWIQAASGGESLLTNMLLACLGSQLPRGKRLRILVTSGTKQGIDSLEKGRSALPADSPLDITIAYFPLDAPHLMQRAFGAFAPKLAVIVETELWPGFLVAAGRSRVPVLLINGRMSEKSFASYRYFTGFFKNFGPEKVWAISPQDGERFAGIVGPERVAVMNNIKFDRIEAKKDLPINTPIARLLPDNSPFILLGSVRREEEALIRQTIADLLVQRQDLVIGLFPKHIERADSWLHLLRDMGISGVKRSQIEGQQDPGTVIVWDVFGELAGAYGLAAATFVGGSLINLGGQNFLEPLVFGLKPIIGPYWKNFAWVGRDIIDAGLIREVTDGPALTKALLAAIETTTNRAAVIEEVQRFFQPRKGGTELISRQIIDKLHLLETPSL
jgi:3-deoxy-D-manno-octulosonic-acid transferase